jgi:hypothetical protein
VTTLTPIGEVGDLFEDAGAVALQFRGASVEPLGCGGRTRDACPEAREQPGRCEADSLGAAAAGDDRGSACEVEGIACYLRSRSPTACSRSAWTASET